MFLIQCDVCKKIEKDQVRYNSRLSSRWPSVATLDRSLRLDGVDEMFLGTHVCSEECAEELVKRNLGKWVRYRYADPAYLLEDMHALSIGCVRAVGMPYPDDYGAAEDDPPLSEEDIIKKYDHTVVLNFGEWSSTWNLNTGICQDSEWEDEGRLVEQDLVLLREQALQRAPFYAYCVKRNLYLDSKNRVNLLGEHRLQCVACVDFVSEGVRLLSPEGSLIAQGCVSFILDQLKKLFT